MTATERQVRMAARLYEARDSIKRIYGDDYKSRIAPACDALKRRAQEDGTDILPAAIRAAQEASPMAAIIWIAASIELMEPSE